MPTEGWVFHTLNGNKLSSADLSNTLTSIFGKRTGANALRRKFLTKHVGGTELLDKYEELGKTMKRMGSSIKAVRSYVKNN
jgi:hypothetical protein